MMEFRRTRKTMVDLTDMRFEMLLVVSFAGSDNNGTKWNCVCDCGNRKTVRGKHLRYGKIKSCGCYRENMRMEKSNARRRFAVPMWHSWAGMIKRCTDPKHLSYKNYGGRGIKVCERWLHNYPNFVMDMGERPSVFHTLDRVDNDGDYEPGNCKWSTKREQARNTRAVLKFFSGDEVCTIWEFFDRIKVPLTPRMRGLIQHRIRYGWSLEEALFCPIQKNGARS